MEQGFRHVDCRNFAPIDVAKGICHNRKQMALADGESCELFERLPKCRHCAHYSAGEEEYLGVCQASTGRPMTYPDLIGITCEWFTWKDA